MEQILFPHLEAMHKALSSSWPALDPELVLLHLLCLRNDLRPPTWWPSHAKSPLVACVSRPSSLSQGHVRHWRSLRARKAVGNSELGRLAPSSAWSLSDAHACAKPQVHAAREGEPQALSSYYNVEMGGDKVQQVRDMSDAMPPTRDWKPGGFPSSDSVEASNCAEFQDSTEATSFGSRPVSKLTDEVSEATFESLHTLTTIRPASAARSSRVPCRSLGDPPSHPSPPTVQLLTAANLFPGAYTRERRVRPHSAMYPTHRNNRLH